MFDHTILGGCRLIAFSVNVAIVRCRIRCRQLRIIRIRNYGIRSNNFYSIMCCRIEANGATNIYINLIFNILLAYSVSPEKKRSECSTTYANNCACWTPKSLACAFSYYCLFGFDKCFEPENEYENQQHGNNILYLCWYRVSSSSFFSFFASRGS